jgi:hypothetical protein
VRSSFLGVLYLALFGFNIENTEKCGGPQRNLAAFLIRVSVVQEAGSDRHQYETDRDSPSQLE